MSATWRHMAPLYPAQRTRDSGAQPSRQFRRPVAAPRRASPSKPVGVSTAIGTCTAALHCDRHPHRLRCWSAFRATYRRCARPACRRRSRVSHSAIAGCTVRQIVDRPGRSAGERCHCPWVAALNRNTRPEKHCRLDRLRVSLTTADSTRRNRVRSCFTPRSGFVPKRTKRRVGALGAGTTPSLRS